MPNWFYNFSVIYTSLSMYFVSSSISLILAKLIFYQNRAGCELEAKSTNSSVDTYLYIAIKPITLSQKQLTIRHWLMPRLSIMGL